MPPVALPAATLDVRDTGGSGPVVVFLHGLLVNGTLWDAVVDRLPDHRCVVPTLPLGSHGVPVADRSALTPFGVADMVADLLERLELRDVTVVASNTGGAIAQLLVTRRPERVSRLVLTPCDALEVFPPALFVPLFKLGRVPLLLSLFLQPLRVPFARRLPIAFGWLTKRASDELLAGWAAPVLRDRSILLDAAHFARHVSPSITLDVAPRLGSFSGEVVVAWPPEDRCFPVELGRRLAAQFRSARFVEVDDSYSFVSVDRPDLLASLI
jgi:pimeloyl-ACP methyl ester carboxylesterase